MGLFLVDRVRATIERYHMFDKVAKMIIAFSAGPDSVCLLDVLRDLFGESVEFELVYVNHGLRSKRVLGYEEKLTKDYAVRYKIKHKILNIKVRKRKEGIEAAARTARYRALSRYLRKIGADRVVLGHNLDDFVETFLLNIVRGSGMRGFRSIPAVRLPFVRPLIDIRKADILDYLRTKRLSYAVDETNLSLDYRRNLLRLKVLPVLLKINPELPDTIRREVEILRHDDEYLWKKAEKVYARVARAAKDCVLLDINKIMRYNFSIVTRLVMKALQDLRGSLDGYESKHYHAIIGLRDKECGKRISLPKGLYAQRERDEIAIGFIKPRAQLRVPLDVSKRGCVIGDYKLSINVARMLDSTSFRENREVFDLKDIELPLYVRNRRVGDLIETKIGKKKVKKIYSEHRIAPRERENTVLVCDQKGILWILGIARAYRGFISKKTKNFLVVEYERID